MRGQRVVCVVLAAAVAGTLAFAQPGRGAASQWLTALGDAQRTSWMRTDDNISVASIAKPGFELQWKVKLENAPRASSSLTQGVTAAGVTLFVPMSIVAGSSNTVHALDNDTGYVVWRREFDLQLPAPAPACPGGITAGATRIVKLDAAPAPPPPLTFGRGALGYRSLVGEPGEGVPVEGRGTAAARGAAPAAAGQRAGGRAGGGRASAPAPPPPPGARGAQVPDRIPGAPRREEAASPYAFLFRESGVVYVITGDGMLHVLGLPSGKDMQRPAQFVPPNSTWSAPVAVGTTLYTATAGNCGGAPDGVWAIDLDSDTKPVTSWKTNGGPVVGAVAFTSNGTLIASIGPGKTTGEDGRANAIVALDPKTLQLKDWFTQPTAEFATGPTIVRHNGRDIVAAATRDGRVVLLDASSLGGADHATPLFVSPPLLEGGTVAAAALAAWQQPADSSWILLAVNGRLSREVAPTKTAPSNGALIALKIDDGAGAVSLKPGWAAQQLASPTTPIVVNGVVFALATGSPARAGGQTSAAVLHAYEGATGRQLWTSSAAMSAFASTGSFWSALGQIYVGTHDGTVYAFGFNDERRHTNTR